MADVLEIPEPEAEATPEAVTETPAQPTETRVTSLPGRGMTKDSVEERFGVPSQKYDPIGEPPITRWDYNGFSVYFEYDHVIHAVSHRQ